MVLPASIQGADPVRLDFATVKAPSARVSFYGWLALAAITLSVAAFGPSLVSSSQRRGSMTVMAGTHAVLMSAWLILYLIQTMLAANGGIGLHKRLGVAGAVVAAAAVATGFAATVAMVQRGFDLSGDLSRPPNDSALDAAIFQFSNLAIFSILVGAALALRRRRHIHKRLMAFAVIETLMAAPLGHLVGHFGLPVLTFVLWGLGVLGAFLAHDIRTVKRVHPVTLILGIGLVALANLEAIVIGPSARWHRVLEWLAG
jgi:uncharacterized membrane protein YozB (DUF420 family)